MGAGYTVSYYHATLCVSAVFAVGRRLCVTLVCCTQMAENIVKKFLFSPVAHDSSFF